MDEQEAVARIAELEATLTFTRKAVLRERREVRSLRDALSLISDATKHYETALKLRRRNKEYGRASATIALLRGRLADLRASLGPGGQSALAAERDQLRAWLRFYHDGDDCAFDHHGRCQNHGWSPAPCVDKTVGDYLSELDKERG